MSTKRIHNIETGEIVDLPFSEKELVDLASLKAVEDELANQKKEIEDAKWAAKSALLERIGITEEEAKLLLGGN